MVTKKVRKQFFPLLFLLLLLDLGSEIRKPGWKKIRIRDKQTGSATLEKCLTKLIFTVSFCSAHFFTLFHDKEYRAIK
jgi:hypothetical protein